jgi:pimeloyl-ACP methyl ester carboxylesterase
VARVGGRHAGAAGGQGDAAAEADRDAEGGATAGVASFVEGRAAGLSPVRVAYERRGAGEPVVLLHGLGLDRRAWDAVVPLLAGEREVIAIDLPGFGQSPDLPACLPHDLPTVVAALSAVFTALGLQRPHVVGHSLGGLIALRLAQADYARTVTALAPAGFWNHAERRYAFAVLTGTLYGRPDLCRPDAVLACLRTLREAVGFEATLHAGRAPDLFTGDIPDVPVTIAWGTGDRILPRAKRYGRKP